MHAIGSTEDIIDFDGRLHGNIHHGTTGNAFLEAATVGGIHLSAHQVDNGRGFVEVKGFSTIFTVPECLFSRITHAKAVIGACTEDFHIGKIIDVIGDIDEHVAVILTLVTVTVAQISLAGTEDLCDLIIIFLVRSDIDESVVKIRFFGNAAIISGSYLICWIIIIIITEATAQDITHPTLRVFHIGRSFTDLLFIFRFHHTCDFRTDAT